MIMYKENKKKYLSFDRNNNYFIVYCTVNVKSYIFNIQFIFNTIFSVKSRNLFIQIKHKMMCNCVELNSIK